MELLWDRDGDTGVGLDRSLDVSALSLASIVVFVVSPFHGSAALVSLTEFEAPEPAARAARENRGETETRRGIRSARRTFS